MAGTIQKIRPDTRPGSQGYVTTAEHNKVVNDLELLRARLDAVCAKLDADAGVAETNYSGGTYGTTSPVNAATVLTAAKIANQAGTAIT